MTKTLAKEWGRLKVCVNCVGFGLVETRLAQLRQQHRDLDAAIESLMTRPFKSEV